ncbi:unnamed protein product [Trichogramma brassicae]|uniref:RNA-directed DNA polymerase n=1 Tax=Trichogramma brassicae TaxID=86971 RepID=A0A6H5IB13_9HYME|nr:unnamed protein product [Trichogramma brassicae]
MEEVQETSTPWDPKTPLGLLPGRLGVNEEPSDESESDSEREPVNWRGRQTQRSWPKTEPAMVTPTDHVRAEQRWKWARMLRDTGLTFSGAKDKLGAETFLARLERYRTKGAIPQEDMLFAVDALLVGEAQVWYDESVEHKLHSWQDFERRFRRSFAKSGDSRRASHRAAAAYTRKGRFREPLPYENQVAIAFRGIRPEYRNFIAHREISSFKELEKAGKEYEKLCRMNAYWHEPVTHANQLHPRAAYKPVQARQCAAVEVRVRQRRRGSSNKKSKKRKSPKKKPTSPPRTPPKEVAALEKTQAPQSNRYGERRTQWKNSNLQPSGGAIRKELRCTNCKQQGHWTTNCPTIECFKCHKKGHMARACPESEDNVERKDIACQVCGQRGVTVPECGRCSYLFDRSGNEQVEARDPTSGGVASATASSTVCRSQTQSLVSGEYNSDEEIECLDSVYMATPETSMPDEQDGADSGPEEGVTVTTIADIHEPRESERRGPTRSIIYLDIAAMTRENRFFVDVRVGPFTYKALLDSGAQCFLAGPRMMRELAERIKPSMSLIGYANQQTQPSGGYLPVMLQIDREAGRIDMECTEILPVEMVLGVDFGRRWRVDISMGRNQWRSGDGPWHNFAKLNEARSMRCDIVAECAGITVCGGEREIIESKIKRLIPDVPPKLGHTDKIVHRIELVEGAKPVCHRTRRMTPKMEKIAHECLQKMKEEGIIEPAKSEWNSAPVLRSYNALLDPVSNAENSWRLVVPAEQRERVLTESHCLTSSGHLGAKKTYDRLACEYWWPGMWYAVEEYCNSCDVCQRYKVPQTGPKGLMTRRVVDRPWAVVAADMMEFPRSKNQNKYLLVFQDLFTRWMKLYRYAKRTMERNTNEEQRRSFAAVVRGATGRTAPSVRPAMDERAGASSSERNASEEARASQEAVAELNEYVRLMELGVPARLRPEPEGRAVVEVSGELIPVFARPSMHASEDAMDWEESVQPGNYSWQRPAWQQRTDADRRRASRQRRQASGVGTRQRTPSPGEGRRPNGGGEPLLEEETRAMLEQLVAARQPVEEWDGEAFEEVFRGSPEEEVLLLEEGEATATLRRSGVRRRRKAHGTICAAVASTSSAGELRGGTAWLGVPAVRRATAAPATDGVSPRRATTAPASPPGALPRAATTSSATSTATATTSARGSPRGGSTSKPGGGVLARYRGTRPHRLASEAKNFGGLEPVGFVPGLDPPRGACFECHEPGHTRRQCRKPYNGDLCTNCGRRGVKVRHCPRCSRGWKKSQRNFHSKRAAARKQLWKALGGGRPRDRLFGLSSEVHTFSHELLERTSDGILKVAKSGDIVGLKDLHQRGYSLLSIDAQGQTALHLASAAGHKDIVRYLIACAPPIILNMVDNDKGQTALHKAAQQKKRSICCMLVAGGARLTVRDLAGNTPRELALIAEDHELAAYLQIATINE